MSLSSLGQANIPLELSPLGPCRLRTFLELNKQNQSVFLQVLVRKVISYFHIKMHPSSNTRFWVAYLSPIHPTLYGQLITYKRSSAHHQQKKKIHNSQYVNTQTSQFTAAKKWGPDALAKDGHQRSQAPCPISSNPWSTGFAPCRSTFQQTLYLH